MFTDAFEFHRDATDDDSLKRMALVRAGFLVWSLTWHDLEFVFGKAPDVPDLLAGVQASDAMAALQRRLDVRWDTAGLRSRLAEPTLMLLVNYLRAPEPTRWKQSAFTALFGLFDQPRMLSDALRADFDDAATALPGQARDALGELPPPIAVAGIGAWNGSAPACFDLFTAFPLAAVQQGDPDAATVVVHLHDDQASREGDGYRRVWNGVLRLFTLLQFLPGVWWTTRTGVERNVYPEFPPPSESPAAPQPASGLSDEDWEGATDLAAPEVHELLRELSGRGAPVPEVGFELVGANGAVLAEAELGWPAHRVAVLLANRQADVGAFEAAGWQAFTTGDDELADALADVLASGTVPTESEGAGLMAARTKMVMSSDFLDAFARLPRPQQRSVRTLISRFNADSTAKGLNYEKIHAARDPAMRSPRIDQGYRAIVLKPAQGDVHMLLWADKHDAAYAWAGRHECRINPETGALQVYEPSAEPTAETEAPAAGSPATAPARPPAFGELRDRELARLGVPAAMLAEVRTVRDDAELDAMQPRLPLEAYEALFLFLAGDSYEKLVRDREPPPEPIDTGDFATALARHESRGRFVVVDGTRGDAQRPAGALAALPPPVAAPPRGTRLERTGAGAGCGRHRQDGGRHAPRAVACPESAGTRPHPVHHVHQELGRRHRSQPGCDLQAGGVGSHRRHEPGPLRGAFPARPALRVSHRLRPR